MFVAVGVGLLLSVRSGAETSATGEGTSSTTSETATSILESTFLPSRLPADAVEVHAPILMYHYVNDTPPPAGPYADGLTVRTKMGTW